MASVDDEQEPYGDASRVTMLLRSLSFPRFCEERTSMVNARRPFEVERSKFARLGWVGGPPSARDLVRRMVARAADDWEQDQLEPPGRRFAMSHTEWVNAPRDDGTYPIHGTSSSRDATACSYSDDSDDDVFRGMDSCLSD